MLSDRDKLTTYYYYYDTMIVYRVIGRGQIVQFVGQGHSRTRIQLFN